MSKDDTQQPTDDQVKSANEMEQARWQDDFKKEELEVPYSREEETKEDTVQEDDKDDTEATDDVDDVVDYEAPASNLTVSDPGEYIPADYSFEVTLKDGKTQKISTPEEAEKIADDPDNFETPKQLMDFLRKSQKMENKLESDKEKYDATKALYEEQAQTEQQRSEAIDNIASEMEYLVSKGLVPAVAKEFKDADWSDPEVAKQPGVKEQNELLLFMAKENEARFKAKVKPISSVVDAYSAWKLEQTEKQAKDDAKADGERRREMGSRVAGSSSAPSGSSSPSGIAVGNPNVFRRGADWS
jgi:transcription elongation factor Elf1